jgi:hypothetical protein
MGISGSQKALMYAQGGVARGGATRGGYMSGRVFVAINGTQYGFARPGAAGIVIESLTITDMLDETPNRAAFRVHAAVPPAGELVITLGSIHNLERLFAGFVTTIGQRWEADNPRFIQAECAAVDYTWQLSFLKVTAEYRNQSASAIASDLIARYGAGNGFTADRVAAGLPTLEEITFTNEDLGDALTRIARRIGGYWYVDYQKRIHVFLEEARNGDPEPLTPSHKSLADFKPSAERTQALTRAYVEGRGSKVLGPVAAGDTLIPVESVDPFAAAADVFLKLSRQGAEGGAQHLNFSGVVASAGGSLVGPGTGPTGPPTLAPAVGAGLAAGAYSYAYTHLTAAGESLPSPLAAIAVGALLNPPSALLALAAEAFPPGVPTPAHYYTYTYVSGGGGETTAPAGTYVDTRIPINAYGLSGGVENLGMFNGGVLTPGYWYYYKITYVGDDGGEANAVAGASVFISTFTPPNNQVWLYIGNGVHPTWPPIPKGVAQVKIYRTPGHPDSSVYFNGPYKYVGSVVPSYTSSGGIDYGTAVFYDNSVTDAGLGAVMPTGGTAYVKAGKVNVSGVTIGPPGTVARRIYRTHSSGTVRLAGTINDNTSTTYVDTAPDASLGALLPTVNTAGDEYRRVQLSNVATGPTTAPAVTSRKIYRTAVNAAQLKLLATLADNTTTTYQDSTADAGLGANAPTGDTSGLIQAAGQIPAGSPSVLVANSGPFPAAGWAIIGNGEQVIRYTGKSGNTLTGIPASGIGAIVAAVAYNSTVTAAPMVTGIPASGTRAIARTLTEGDELYLVVQVDDTAAAAELAAAVGGQGIREEWIQDRRLSIAEARARGQATLKVRPVTERSVRYRSRDLRTAAGKTIVVNLPAPSSITGTYKIQQVTIGKFRPYGTQYPTYTVEASSARFTFEDFLRRIKTAV